MSAGLLLDTVVVSELRRGSRADTAVVAWQASVAAIPAYLSVITLLEIRVGIRRVAVRLEAWYGERLLPSFGGRLLAGDRAVAEAAAGLATSRTLPPHDALIAATARVHGLTLVTRNIPDFADTGVPVVNPWLAPAP